MPSGSGGSCGAAAKKPSQSRGLRSRNRCRCAVSARVLSRSNTASGALLRSSLTPPTLGGLRKVSPSVLRAGPAASGTCSGDAPDCRADTRALVALGCSPVRREGAPGVAGQTGLWGHPWARPTVPVVRAAWAGSRRACSCRPGARQRVRCPERNPRTVSVVCPGQAGCRPCCRCHRGAGAASAVRGPVRRDAGPCPSLFVASCRRRPADGGGSHIPRPHTPATSAPQAATAL